VRGKLATMCMRSGTSRPRSLERQYSCSSLSVAGIPGPVLSYIISTFPHPRPNSLRRSGHPTNAIAAPNLCLTNALINPMSRCRMRQFAHFLAMLVPEQICRNVDTMSLEWILMRLPLGWASLLPGVYTHFRRFSRKSRLAREVPLTNLRALGRKTGG
jgi:hypothetical protein